MSEDNADPATLACAPPPESNAQSILRSLSLNRVQSVVAILAGVASVFGAAISVAGVGRPANTGMLVEVVHMTGSTQPATDATVEVLTPQNAIVATLTPDASGRVSRELKEGMYLVRVSHPRYTAAVQRIDVQPGQTVELRTTLRAGSSASVDRTVSKGMSAIRRALGF